MSVLVGTDGPLHDRRFEVDSELVLGREGQALTVDDSEISRRHAVVRRAGDALTIEDLGSRNGTFVNGQRIAGVVALAHGDVVRLGSTSFRVDATVPAPAPPGHPPAGVAAAPAAAAPLAREPAQPFGTFAATDVAGHPRRTAASRQLVPELIAIIAVVGTAALLVLYFALR